MTYVDLMFIVGRGTLRNIFEAVTEEFVLPNGDIQFGHDIAAWDEAPSPSEVNNRTNGQPYEKRSGTLLTDDLQVAR